MPAPILFDSTVRVTIRHSDSEAIASDAATASLNRGDATAAAGLVKPAATADRVMVQILEIQYGPIARSHRRANHPHMRFVTIFVGEIAAGTHSKMAKSGQLGFYARYPRNPSPVSTLTPVPPCPTSSRRAASPSARSRGFVQRASARCESPERSRGHSRTARRHGCSRRARCRRP